MRVGLWAAAVSGVCGDGDGDVRWALRMFATMKDWLDYALRTLAGVGLLCQTTSMDGDGERERDL